MSGALTASSVLNGPRVNLSGTPGSPNLDTHDTTNPTPANAGWHFLSNGNCTKFTGAAHNKPEWFGKLVDTEHTTVVHTYYIRATTESGDLPDNGDVLNSWLTLNSSRSWYWTETTPFDASHGIIKVEIASDSGGTDIRATGYYRGLATQDL